MKNIKDFLPQNKSLKTQTVQGQVDASLVRDVKKIMAKNNLRWSEILTAALRRVKEEMHG